MPEALGAYGLRLLGADGAEAALVPASDTWPLVHLRVEVGAGQAGPEHLGDVRAHVRLRTGGCIDIDRQAGSAVYSVPSPLSPDELVHPYLAPVAAVTAHWYGRESFHAGAVAIGGGVWAVVGDRHSGKSTTLAALALRGLDVVSDDVLVVDGLEAFAGPRTIDLRADAAAHLGAGEGIGFAGARKRWRLRLSALDRRLTLSGWLFTTWADDAVVARLPSSATLSRLLRHRAINAVPNDASAFLPLCALPAWELRRPRSWDALPGAVDRLLQTVGG